MSTKRNRAALLKQAAAAHTDRLQARELSSQQRQEARAAAARARAKKRAQIQAEQAQAAAAQAEQAPSNMLAVIYSSSGPWLIDRTQLAKISNSPNNRALRAILIQKTEELATNPIVDWAYTILPDGKIYHAFVRVYKSIPPRLIRNIGPLPAVILSVAQQQAEQTAQDRIIAETIKQGKLATLELPKTNGYYTLDREGRITINKIRNADIQLQSISIHSNLED